MDLLSRLVTPTGTKGCTRHVALAAPFVPIGVTNRDKRVLFVPVARPGTKEHPLLSRPDVPGWKTGTTKVFQPGQISLSLVVAGTNDSSCPVLVLLFVVVTVTSSDHPVQDLLLLPDSRDPPLILHRRNTTWTLLDRIII